MGLKNWFKGIILKRELKKEKSSIIDISEEYLKRAMLENSQQIKVSERLNRANLLHASTKQLREAAKTALEAQEDDENEEDDEDYEEEESDDFIESIGQDMAKQLISSFMPKTSGVPSPAAVAATSVTPSVKDKYHKLLEGLTEEQAAALEAKYGKFLK